MGLLYSQSSSGLVLATEGVDEAAARAALRQHDSELRLVPQDSDVFGRSVYKVYRYMGSERPAEFVCGWWDEHGEPYDQLSVTGLIDMVQRHDRNLRGERVTLEQLEQRRRDEVHKAGRRDLDAIVDEHRDRVSGKKQQLLQRSQSLRRARDKTRAHTNDPDLRP